MVKHLYRKRQFLNERHGMAAVQATVTYRSGTYKHHKTKKKIDTWSIDASFHLSDCSRQVALDFDCSSDYRGIQSAERILRKVRRFSKVVQGFEAALKAATEKARQAPGSLSSSQRLGSRKPRVWRRLEEL